MNEKYKIVKISSLKLDKLEKTLRELKAENAQLRASLKSQFNNEVATVECSENYLDLSEYNFGWENWLDSEGKILWVNPGVKKITGFTPAECMEMDNFPSSLIYPPDISDFEKKFDEILKSPAEQHSNFRITHKEGHPVWVSARWVPIIAKTGEKLGIRAAIHDIDSQSMTPDSQNENEDFYRTIVESLEQGLIVADGANSIIFANDKYCQMIGFDRSDIIGFPPPFDLGASDLKKHRFELSGSKKMGTASFEVKILTKKGGNLFSLISPSPIYDDDGEFKGSFALVTDISRLKEVEDALRESESLYRSVVESPLAGIAILDSEYNVLYINEYFSEMTGYSVEEIRNSNLKDFIAPKSIRTIKSRYERRKNGENPAKIYTIDIKQKSGEKRIVEISENVLVLQDGKTQIISHFIDATDRIKLEREREKYLQAQLEIEQKRSEALQLAEHTARLASIGVIAGGITHEINQPLNAIMMHAEAAKYSLQKGLTDKMSYYLEALEKISLGTRRIADIIKHMRSFWVAPSVSTFEAVDLDLPVIDALKLTERKIRTHNIDLQMVREETELKVKGDRLQIEQVIINLITNAINAIDQSGKKEKMLKIKTFRSGNNAVIEVFDNGSGIEPGKEELLFDPFYSGNKHLGGTGLGLAIVRTFVERFGGKVSAKNNELGGASFTVEFPIFK